MKQILSMHRLKDQREKRDQLKEKKFQAQLKKNTPATKGDE